MIRRGSGVSGGALPFSPPLSFGATLKLIFGSWGWLVDVWWMSRPTPRYKARSAFFLLSF